MSEKSTTIQVDPTPTPEEEQASTFSNEQERAERLENDRKQQALDQRGDFAERAFGLTQAWVGFIIVVTITQITLGAINIPNLSDPAFIAVLTTTTATIIGLWAIVGSGLFKSR